MVTMTALGAAYTVDDLDAMPDDGRRYELIDGTLIVTPAPSGWHQLAVSRLLVALSTTCPSNLVVLVAPVDVRLAQDTLIQPDVLVIPRFTVDGVIETTPLLAVEVLSPSTRRYDLTLKRARLEAAGCPAYWVVDVDQPRLTCWELREGRYVEVADVQGRQRADLAQPFPCRIVPADLIA